MRVDPRTGQLVSVDSGGFPQRIDLLIAARTDRFERFRVSLVRDDGTLVLHADRMVRDSNNDLRLSLNTSILPDGKYLIGLNKLSHGRHLSVGPSQPESSQLVDISDEKMKLLYDAFTEPEPHYAQIIKADKLKPIEVYPKEENKHPLAIWDVKDAGVTRTGNKVLVKMVAVRSTMIGISNPSAIPSSPPPTESTTVSTRWRSGRSATI